PRHRARMLLRRMSGWPFLGTGGPFPGRGHVEENVDVLGVHSGLDTRPDRIMRGSTRWSRPLVEHLRHGSGLRPLLLLRAHQATTDDQTLDLAGALVQTQQADVAVEALHGNPTHVTGATVHLDGEIGRLTRHLGAEELRCRGRDTPVLATDVLAGGVADQGTAGEDTGLLIGEHGLHELE